MNLSRRLYVQELHPLILTDSYFLKGQVVVVQQPQYTGPTPPDYCTHSILNTLFCCFWVGIFAIMKSQAVRDAINRGKCDCWTPRT